MPRDSELASLLRSLWGIAQTDCVFSPRKFANTSSRGAFATKTSTKSRKSVVCLWIPPGSFLRRGGVQSLGLNSLGSASDIYNESQDSGQIAEGKDDDGNEMYEVFARGKQDRCAKWCT